MTNRIATLAAVVAILSSAATAQWGTPTTISRPSQNAMWTIQHQGATYALIPCDLIDRMVHKKLRKLVGGTIPGEGFMFFVAAIDNTNGKSPQSLSASDTTVTFHCTQSGMEAPQTYYVVDLRDYFNDPDNTPQDAKTYEQAKALFRTDLTIPPGKTGWTLIAVRNTLDFERLERIEWALPGTEPKPLAEQKCDPALIKKLGITLIPWD